MGSIPELRNQEPCRSSPPCTMPDQPLVHRPGETLPLSIDLLKLAEVTRKDVLKAVEAWEENPPNDKYSDILGASDDA